MVGVLLATGFYVFIKEHEDNVFPVFTYEPLPVMVEILEVKPGSISSWTFSEGTVEALRKAYLYFENPGKVTYITKLADGSSLREGSIVQGPDNNNPSGQLLAVIENRQQINQVKLLKAKLKTARNQLTKAESDIAHARNNLRQSELDFFRIKTIYEKGVVAREKYERYYTDMINKGIKLEGAKNQLQVLRSEEEAVSIELDKANIALEKTMIFAPFDGVISKLDLAENNYSYPPTMTTSNIEREVSSGIVVVDNRFYEVKLEVSEAEADLIQEGQSVYIAQDDTELFKAADTDFDDLNITWGRVWSVSPSLSLERRARMVRVRTVGNSESIQDGMFVRVWIATQQKPDVLALPWQVISFQNEQPYVFVVNKNGRAEQRWLTLGMNGIFNTEITRGLRDGDKVIVRGQHLLDEDSVVEISGSM